MIRPLPPPASSCPKPSSAVSSYLLSPVVFYYLPLSLRLSSWPELSPAVFCCLLLGLLTSPLSPAVSHYLSLSLFTSGGPRHPLSSLAVFRCIPLSSIASRCFPLSLIILRCLPLSYPVPLPSPAVSRYWPSLPVRSVPISLFYHSFHALLPPSSPSVKVYP